VQQENREQAIPTPDGAFEAFRLAHGPKVLRFFLGKGIPFAEAAEFTQDVLLSVYLHQMHTKPEEEAVPWLFTVTRNTAVSHLRKRGCAERKRPMLVREMMEVRERSPEEETLAQARIGRLREQIKDLPEMARRCLLLRYYQDMPPPEIGAFLEISVNTVKTHLKRGLSFLRRRLEGECT
jgi:RNA polymerase sigma-70 factor, ECF subfamily